MKKSRFTIERERGLVHFSTQRSEPVWHDQLPSITYWPMGSLASAQLSQLGWIALPVAGLIALPWRLGRVLDVMPMDDDEVRALEVSIGLALRHDPSGHASLGTGSLGGRHDRLSWADLLSAQKVVSTPLKLTPPITRGLRAN